MRGTGASYRSQTGGVGAPRLWCQLLEGLWGSQSQPLGWELCVPKISCWGAWARQLQGLMLVAGRGWWGHSLCIWCWLMGGKYPCVSQTRCAWGLCLLSNLKLDEPVSTRGKSGLGYLAGEGSMLTSRATHEYGMPVGQECYCCMFVSKHQPRQAREQGTHGAGKKARIWAGVLGRQCQYSSDLQMYTRFWT